MCVEVCFSQKMFTNLLNMLFFFHNEAELKLQSMEWKHTDLFCKEKKSTRRTVCDMKGTIAIGFLEEGATVNSASGC